MGVERVFGGKLPPRVRVHSDERRNDEVVIREDDKGGWAIIRAKVDLRADRPEDTMVTLTGWAYAKDRESGTRQVGWDNGPTVWTLPPRDMGELIGLLVQRRRDAK